MSSFFKKLFSPILWVNILLMVALVVLLVIGTVVCLSAYTRHGETIKVPDVGRLPMLEARKTLRSAGLGIEVVDTGYVKELPMDCVLEQKPLAGATVKKGRIISIVVNASTTPTIAIPDVIQNCSLREAVARLKSMGFKVGDPEYVQGEREWVYGITVDGRRRNVGERIPINKVVIVQAGNGYMAASDSVVYVEMEYDTEDPDEEEVIYDDDFVELVE